MGYEKLLLQGIPFSRLLLGPETEVQLSDLAGNAMSVSVVSATILAAICAPQLRKERRNNAKVLLKEFALGQQHDAARGAVLAERGDMYQRPHASPKTFEKVFSAIARDLARDAFWSSVLSTCESSGTTSRDAVDPTRDAKIFIATACGTTFCQNDMDRYQTASHDLKELEFSGKRPDPHAFEQRLRCSVPSILRLGEGCEALLDHGAGLESYSFQLQQVDRARGHWLLTYGAWEDHGSGRQVAEIRVRIGQTHVLDLEFGVAAAIRCFAPAIRNDKPHRGPLKDSARFLLKIGGSNNATEEPRWYLPEGKPTSHVLRLIGSDPVPSQRLRVGLNDDAAKALRRHQVQKRYLPPVKSRNPVTHYHEMWKTW